MKKFILCLMAIAMVIIFPSCEKDRLPNPAVYSLQQYEYLLWHEVGPSEDEVALDKNGDRAEDDLNAYIGALTRLTVNSTWKKRIGSDPIIVTVKYNPETRTVQVPDPNRPGQYTTQDIVIGWEITSSKVYR